jgi:predicted amidophosphoribosyltransferase
MKTCPACFTDIPLKASRCPNCTSELAPPACEEEAVPA